MVPSVNKGLKSSLSDMPSSRPEAAIIDYLTFTLTSDAVLSLFDGASSVASGYAAQHEATQRQVAAVLLDHLGLGDLLKLSGDRSGFRSFYDHHFKLYTPSCDVCGIIAFGGERQRFTTMVQLTGAGCAHVVEWAKVRARLASLSARITRVDVAHDDYEGTHTVDDVVAWHRDGLFTSNGRAPSMQLMGWDDGSGRSVYIGKNIGNQQLVVYEKGREQGARDGDPSANWVRFEARFGAKYREIPYDILTNPVEYLVGHYPPLRYWISAVCSRMRTSKERAASNLAGSIRWARRQYGSLINLLAEHIPEPELFARFLSRHVAKKTPPPWLKSNPFGADVIRSAIDGRMEDKS